MQAPGPASDPSVLPLSSRARHMRHALLGALSIAVLAASAQEPTVGRPAGPSPTRIARTLRPHPRLWMPRGAEAAVRMKVATDARFRAAWRMLLAEADDLAGRPPVERVMTGRRLLHVSRETIRRVMALGMAWRVTGDARYLAPARANLLAAAAFPDWNPNHFLDVAEMTLAIGVGYDWLFDVLSPADRALLRDAIIGKGVNESFLPGNGGWATGDNNWNQVCHGGLVAGVLAIAEEEPALAARTIGRALDGLPHAMRHYAPDGAYPEGPSYWDYGTTYNVVLAAALESALGSDFGITTTPGFLQTADYFLHVTGPSGEYFNYADAGQRRGVSPSPAQYYFARRRGEPSLVYTENALLGRALAATSPESPALDRFFPLLFLWADTLGSVPAPAATHYVGRGDTPVALYRTSWDPDATFLGVKGGSPSVNHAHMDVGSFVVDMRGVRVASDLGMQDYNSLEQRGLDLWNRSQDSDRWQIFRIGALSHNVITVERGPQRVAARADFVTTTRHAAVLDLSAVYAGALRSASRGAALEADGRVRIQDELATGRAATVRWAMLTRAEVELSGATATLRLEGEAVTMRITAPDDAVFRVYSTDPPHDYDAPNPGTRLVGLEVPLAAGASRTIVVDLEPGSIAAVDRPIVPLAAW